MDNGLCLRPTEEGTWMRWLVTTLPFSEFTHKPKALQAKTGELKYPALNADPVSQTPWEHRL